RRCAAFLSVPQKPQVMNREVALWTVSVLAALQLSAHATSIAKDTGQVLVSPLGYTLIHRLPTQDFKPTAGYLWLDVMLEASDADADRSSPRPTILWRTMASVLTWIYDAWAAYDDVAVGTRLGDRLRRPPAERTQANKEKAIAFAAYRSLLFVYPEDAPWIRDQFRTRGFDPNNASTDVAPPDGIGNTAANAIIEYRRHDGANQLGDEPGGNGEPYADYSGYAPKNAPGHVVDPIRWMPIPFSDGSGGTVSPGF